MKKILIESNSWALIGASCTVCSLEAGGTETLIGCLFFKLPTISSKLFAGGELDFVFAVSYKKRTEKLIIVLFYGQMHQHIVI